MTISIIRKLTERQVRINDLNDGDFFRVAEFPGRTYIRLTSPLGTEALCYLGNPSIHHAEITKFSPNTLVVKLNVTIEVQDA
jgi:hypothetical protein